MGRVWALPWREGSSGESSRSRDIHALRVLGPFRRRNSPSGLSRIDISDKLINSERLIPNSHSPLMAQAAAATRPARSRDQQKDSPWNEPIGIAMLVSAAMYILALISYDPRDLPSWSHFSTADQNSGVMHNFIGTLGATVAGYSLALARAGAPAGTAHG